MKLVSKLQFYNVDLYFAYIELEPLDVVLNEFESFRVPLTVDGVTVSIFRTCLAVKFAELSTNGGKAVLFSSCLSFIFVYR